MAKDNIIRLDADFVRAEVAEAPEEHDLTPELAARFDECSDDYLEEVLLMYAADELLDAMDRVRGNAIARVVRDMSETDG